MRFLRSLFLPLFCVFVLSGAMARAATFTVTSTADKGSGGCTAAGTGDGCTLREAIVAANANANADTIVFNVSGTVALASDLPVVNHDVTISGPAASTPAAGVTISGGNARMIFTISGGNVSLQNLTIANGRGNAATSAGGVHVTSGTVRIESVDFENNLGSSASTTLAANGAGALSVNGGSATALNSTFHGNSGAAATGAFGSRAGKRGGAGAIQISNGNLTIVHCTIAQNSGGTYAIDRTSTGIATKTYTSGGAGGIAVLGGTLTLANSVIAQNTAGKYGAANISGSYTAQGNNLIDVDPQLNAYADNGGPTKTFLPKATSPALDAGDNAVAAQYFVDLDQRGVSRPFNNVVDIGAVEVSDEVPGQTFVAHNQGVSTPEDTSKDITLTATGSGTIAYSIVTNPAHGTLSGTAPNLTYTPNANFNGADSFTFQADNGTDSDTTTVAISVAPVNDAPVATDGNVTAHHNTPLVIDLSTLASDVETNDADLTYEIVSAPDADAGTLSGEGSTRTFTPDSSFVGQTSFTFRVHDSGDPAGTPGNALTSATKTVSITVGTAAIVITSPIDGDELTSFGDVTGTVDVGSSGVDHVVLEIVRQSDGKFWNGANWVSDETGITATVTEGNFSVAANSLPSGANLLPGDYLLRAVAYYQEGDVEVSSDVIVTVPMPFALSNLSLNPTSVAGGTSSIGTVTLNHPAQGDAIVSLSSSDTTIAAVPTSVTVLSGQTTATFTVSTPERAAAASAVITASLDNVSKNATLAVTATPYSPKPDALIKLNSEKDANYALDNIYQSTPANTQIKTQSVAVNAIATYQVKIQNDGSQSQRFVVKLSETTESGWTTSYKIGSSDVSSALKGASGRTTALLSPGGFEIITVAMKPSATGVQGTSKSATFNVFNSVSDTTVRDSVRAVTTTPAIAFDLKIQDGADGPYVGNGIINTTASGQAVSDSVQRNATATYYITFSNNKGSNDQFKLKANAGTSGWTVRYFDANNFEITANVIADNYLSPQIATGTNFVIKCTVSPGFGVLVGQSFSVLATATSAYNATVKDAVKATTTAAK